MSNPFTATPTETTVSGPIEDGDCGLILRKDGSFNLFNCHSDFDPTNVSPELLKQGAILHAFSVALRVPALLDFLMEQAAVFEASERLDGSRKPHLN